MWLIAAEATLALATYLAAAATVRRYPQFRAAKIVGALLAILLGALLAAAISPHLRFSGWNPETIFSLCLALSQAITAGTIAHLQVSDHLYQRLANEITFTLWGAGIAASGASFFLNLIDLAHISRAILLALALSTFLAAAHYLANAVGFGDVKLIGALVISAGAIPGSDLLAALFGFVIAGCFYLLIAAISGYLLRGETRLRRLPFGPILIGAYIFSLLPTLSL